MHPHQDPTHKHQVFLKTPEEAAGIKKPAYIDIDINPNPRYKSNEVFSAAKGWVEGSGYEVRFKTFGPLVTTFADWVVKR